MVQDADHDVLAVRGGQRGNAHVDAAIVDHQPDPPVLGTPTLGDVHVGHDLQAADKTRTCTRGYAHHFVKHTVDPESHAHARLARLDVDVARFIEHGLADELVHQANDRDVLVPDGHRRLGLFLHRVDETLERVGGGDVLLDRVADLRRR